MSIGTRNKPREGLPLGQYNYINIAYFSVGY